MKWTDRQQQAITAQGQSLLVSAAAGSGKTAVLIERIKRMILSGETDVDRILVVTFTRAAAEEMKEKLITAMREEIASDPSHAGRLRDQLNRIYRASINTFSAFALELVRRYYYLIDIDPGVTVCDEAEAQLLEHDAMDQVFEEYFEAGDEEFLRFLDCCSDDRSEADLKDNLLQLYHKLRSLPHPFEWMESAVGRLDEEEADFAGGPVMAFIEQDTARRLRRAADDIAAAERMLADRDLPRLAEKVRGDRQALEEAAQADSFDARLAVLGRWKSTVLRPKKEEKADFDLVSEQVKALRDGAKKKVADLCALYYTQPLGEQIDDTRRTASQARMVQQLLQRFDVVYREYKEENRLDFGDIEHFALRILENEEAAAECREHYEQIYIDEYQDSNYLQEAIIHRIRRPDNVFMVGDIKQSIYSFRLAEPDIFRDRYREYSAASCEQGRVIDLNSNFRSKKPVIDAVNDIFGDIMEGYDERAALKAGLTEDGGIVMPVELTLVDATPAAEPAEEEDRDKTDEGRPVSPEETAAQKSDASGEALAEMKAAELEALAVVQQIRDLLGTEIYDSKLGRRRKLQRRDIVILMRSARNRAEIYYQTLKEHDIDAYLENNGGYFDTLEIMTFTDLLRVIDNSHQDIPLLSVLRSTIFGYSIDDLITVRTAARDSSFRDALEQYARQGGEEALRRRAAATLRRLAEWRRDSLARPLDDFIWSLMRDTGYYAYVGALPGGSQRQANLRALVDRTTAFRRRSEGSIYALLRYIDATGSRRIETGQVRLISENDDVIRIMTIHKSKGLEFPVVFVTGLGQTYHRTGIPKSGIMHKDLGFAMTRVEPQQHWFRHTLPERVIRERARQDEMAEELRILYVAMTRAQDKLVLTAAVKNPDQYLEKAKLGGGEESCYLDAVCGPIRRHGIRVRREDRQSLGRYLQIQRQRAVSVQELLLKRPQRDGVYAEIDRRLSFAYPYAEEAETRVKYSVSELNAAAARKAGGAGEPRPGGADGTAAAAEAAAAEAATAATAGEREPQLRTPQFLAGRHRYTAAEIGTLYHSVMEHLDLERLKAADPSAREEEVSRQIREMVQREILFAEEAEQIAASRIARFFDSSPGRRLLAAAGHAHREQPFTLRWPQADSQVMVQGIIDCWFRDDEGLVLLDYKTSYTSEGIREKYQTQMDIYRRALEAAAGREVDEAYLYLFSEDLLVQM